MIQNKTIKLECVSNRIWKKIKYRNVNTEDFHKNQFYEFYNTMIKRYNPDILISDIANDYKRYLNIEFDNGDNITTIKMETKKGEKEYTQKYFHKKELNEELCLIQQRLKEIDSSKLIYNMKELGDVWLQYRNMYDEVYNKYNNHDAINMDGEVVSFGTKTKKYDNGFNEFYKLFLKKLNITIDYLFLRLQHLVTKELYDKIKNDKSVASTLFGLLKLVDDKAQFLIKEYNENKEFVTEIIEVPKLQKKERANKKQKQVIMTDEEFNEKYDDVDIR